MPPQGLEGNAYRGPFGAGSLAGAGGSPGGVDVPGEVIDSRYVVGELLGRGGMAEVFRATDTATDRSVAVKVLRSAEPGTLRRFGSEAEVLARLDHPGLVKLRSSGTHDGVPYLVLDLADGPSLAGELATGPIGIDRALTVGEQVADALAHAHRLGVVHRDVKPSNVLFDDLGRVRLADFGIARLAGTPSLTGTGQLIGSAPYIAPEQVSGETAGPAADVYALGLVLVECLTGRPCYPGSRVEAVVARLHHTPDIPEDLPEWLRDVLSAMTATDPRRRPAAGAVADAFRHRHAAPVIAATAPLDREAVASLAGGGAVDQTATTEHMSRQDPTALYPAGSVPRSDGPRLVSARGGRALLAAAVLCIAVVTLLAWTVTRSDPPASQLRDEPVATSSTSVATTTVAPSPPPEPDADGAPPEAGHENDGNGNGRTNGNGQGNGNGRGNGRS